MSAVKKGAPTLGLDVKPTELAVGEIARLTVTGATGQSLEWFTEPPHLAEIETTGPRSSQATLRAIAAGVVQVAVVVRKKASSDRRTETVVIQPCLPPEDRIAGTIERLRREGLTVRAGKESTPKVRPLWKAIRACGEGRSFKAYEAFVRRLLCEKADSGAGAESDLVREMGPSCRYRYGVRGFELLKAATEVFLLCSTCDSEKDLRNILSPESLPYLKRILDSLDGGSAGGRVDAFPFCESSSRPLPPFFELIWSYWHEEGMLVQTMNVISRRFQNRTSGAPNGDPLANLELSPLRPLNNLLWGYIQDAVHQLDIRRRAFEYEHEYGLPLSGKAVGRIRPADRRTRFLESFHTLLRHCAAFYRDDSNTWVTPDTFPLLQNLRETHLILSEGAHNEFGDLPSMARREMMIQQWLLAQRPMQDFLRGRAMVPYQEDWMGAVDAMKRLMGWTQPSVFHFNRLAVYGEQILLSIRYDDWTDLGFRAEEARDWAQEWKNEIQSYGESYRIVTGVDLMANGADAGPVDTTPPSQHLLRRHAAGQ